MAKTTKPAKPKGGSTSFSFGANKKGGKKGGGGGNSGGSGGSSGF